MREVTVAGIRMVESSNDIVLLLADRGRQLPIWIGSPEAAAIALAQQGVQPNRPLTHDLINDLLRALRAPCERVEITALTDGIFYADLVLANGARVSARPSDAVAVALRAQVPIFVADDVLDAAGIIDGPQGEDAELDAFRAFLEDISPEDFGTA